MDQLSALNKELGYPSAGKLFEAAQRAGIRVKFKDVRTFVASQNVRQVFHKLPRSEGKITAPDLDDTWVADLVDYTSRPSESKSEDKLPPFQYILVVQDIFSRRLMAVPLRDKLPETCQKALESIIQERKVKPVVLATDLGSEFKGPFDEYLAREHIYHQLKDPRSLNAQGTLDAAIRALRPTLSRIQAEEGTRNWAAEVERAVKTYNHLAHSHLHGRSPDEVVDDGDLRFHLEKEAAQDLQHNSDLVKRRDAKIAAAGHFREELQPRKFHRGFQANYDDHVHTVQSVFNNRIVDSHGDVFVGRHVLPVAAGSGHINTEGLRGGSSPVDEKRKAALEPFKGQIAAYIGAEGKWLHEVAQKMKDLNMADLISRGLNYRTALLLLGFQVAQNGRVTQIAAGGVAPAPPIVPAAPAAAAPAAPVGVPPGASAALDPYKAGITAFIGPGPKWIHEVAAHMKAVGMQPLMRGALNYKKALILLGFRVDDRGAVTPPRPILPPAVAAAALANPVRRRLGGKQAGVAL